MFASATKIERGVENVARKIGIDPKVASKTWKNVTDNFSKSKAKLMKRATSDTPDKYTHNYQRISHTSINVNANASMSSMNPHKQSSFNVIKYALYCLVFFGCIIMLNFIFTKHLDQTNDTKIPPNGRFIYIEHSNGNSTDNDNTIHINYDEGLPALMDNIHDPGNKKSNGIEDEMDELFNRINAKNQTSNDLDITNYENANTDHDTMAIREDPTLEEKSMKSLEDNMQQIDMPKDDIIDRNEDKESIDTDKQIADESIDNDQDDTTSSNQEKASIDDDDDDDDESSVVFQGESVMDLKEHQYHSYPQGLSNPSVGIFYLAMIADMDKASKTDKYKWRSYLQHAKLVLRRRGNKEVSDSMDDVDPYDYHVEVTWIPPPFEYNEDKVKIIKHDKMRDDGSKNDTCCYTVIIDGGFNEKGRGMELSELIRFNNLLYAFDDRTGIVYEISREFEAIPRQILMEGDGNIAKGMKIEWATYKEDEELLYIGSIGREYTNEDGTKIRKLGLLWVVTLDKEGIIEHHDWTERYMKIREVTGTLFPGYLWIEAVEWSQIHKKWFILPRYVSFEKYDGELTENRGCNLLIIASEDFDNIEIVWIKFKTKTKIKETADKVNVIQEDSRRNVIDIMDRKLMATDDNEYNDNDNFGYKSMNDLNSAQLRSMSVKQENMKTYLQHSNKGFSTMRFIPNTNDTMIICIRTQENNKQVVNSFLTVIDIKGNVYLQSKKMPLRKKYEGLVIL